MRIPRRLRIGRQTWTIRFVKEIQSGSSGSVCLGMAYLDEHRIDIVMGMTPRLRQEIFLHELFHALAETHGFRIPHGALNSLADNLERCFHKNGIKLLHEPVATQT